MNLILSIPMEARLAVVFVLGACLGSAVNWAVYRLAWTPRSIGPWTAAPSNAPLRSAWDRVPIFGWIGLRRESALHGRGYWIRPMLLELFCGLGLAWLYGFETSAAQTGAHQRFIAHAALLALMLAASMIDVDEKIIPDGITIPGTLVGLLLAAVAPQSLLAAGAPDEPLGFLHLASPNPWPKWLDGFPHAWPLVIALACYLAWCAAILPRVWNMRHGWRRAAEFFWFRLSRDPMTYRIFRMAIVGAALIVVVWFRGGPGWQGLLSALVGMAAAGGLVWGVRLVGAAALRREAMGFGDVTLMAMIGAFLGWQPCLIVFFLAPFAGLVVGILRVALFRDREIPYGPFLCLAALVLIVRWDSLWGNTWHLFELGWFVPALMVVCLLLMGVMLGVWQLIVRAFHRSAR